MQWYSIERRKICGFFFGNLNRSLIRWEECKLNQSKAHLMLISVPYFFLSVIIYTERGAWTMFVFWQLLLLLLLFLDFLTNHIHWVHLYVIRLYELIRLPIITCHLHLSTRFHVDAGIQLTDNTALCLCLNSKLINTIHFLSRAQHTHCCHHCHKNH